MKIIVDDIEIDISKVKHIQNLDFITKDYTLHLEGVEDNNQEIKVKNKED